MSRRSLVFVTALTVGDYLLWNWSLNGNHDVLALVSGLTLPPLAVVCVWLLALSVARLLARSASASRSARRGTGASAGAGQTRRARRASGAGRRRAATVGGRSRHPVAMNATPTQEPPASPTPAGSRSRKLAA